MREQDERERQSQETPGTFYEDEREADEEETDALADDLLDDPALEPREG